MEPARASAAVVVGIANQRSKHMGKGNKVRKKEVKKPKKDKKVADAAKAAAAKK